MISLLLFALIASVLLEVCVVLIKQENDRE